VKQRRAAVPECEQAGSITRFSEAAITHLNVSAGSSGAEAVL
jgi:hypothetical protein